MFTWLFVFQTEPEACVAVKSVCSVHITSPEPGAAVCLPLACLSSLEVPRSAPTHHVCSGGEQCPSICWPHSPTSGPHLHHTAQLPGGSQDPVQEGEEKGWDLKFDAIINPVYVSEWLGLLLLPLVTGKNQTDDKLSTHTNWKYSVLVPVTGFCSAGLFASFFHL